MSTLCNTATEGGAGLRAGGGTKLRPFELDQTEELCYDWDYGKTLLLHGYHAADDRVGQRRLQQGG